MLVIGLIDGGFQLDFLEINWMGDWVIMIVMFVCNFRRIDGVSEEFG